MTEGAVRHAVHVPAETREALDRRLNHACRNGGVNRKGKMGAVLLDCTDRQNRNDFFAVKPGERLACVVAPISLQLSDPSSFVRA